MNSDYKLIKKENVEQLKNIVVTNIIKTSKRESFYKEGQATILFENHQMWEYLKKDLKKSYKE